MDPNLLYVESSNHNQKILLESEYLSKDDCFVVPVSETETVQAIIRSLSFQYFQNSMPQIAQKIRQFAFKSLGLTFSLSLLREIFALVHQQHQTIKKFKQYFIEINQRLSDHTQQQQAMLLGLQNSEEEDKDYLFELAQRGQVRATRLVEQLDLDEEIDVECNMFNTIETVTADSQYTARKDHKSQVQRRQQKIGFTSNFINFFYSAQSNTGCEWRQKQNKISQESKEISRFDRKGRKVINQKSITEMMIAEMKRDLNRQIQLGKEGVKNQEEIYKFNKMIKGKLMQAKMKSKKKRK